MDSLDSLILLIHSPLVGPFTWSLVAQQLQADGYDVLLPSLSDSGETPPSYWQQYAKCVQQSLASIPSERPLVLVGHSGAGPLLPVLAQAIGRPVNACIFVDAGLPHPGKSQLEEMESNAPEFAQALRELLASGARFPNWKNEDLLDELPDEHARQQMLAEMQPRSLDYFEEVLPDVPGPSDASCGYLLFTEGYRPYLEQAQHAGWPNKTIPAGHFYMLVDPASVSLALIELIKMLT